MKIVILDAYAANPGDLSWDEFAALGDLTVYDRTAQEDAAARIGDAEVVFINKVRLTDEIFAACPALVPRTSWVFFSFSSEFFIRSGPSGSSTTTQVSRFT